MISTHAPAGGATVGRGAVRIQLYNFYSRPCGRGDKPRCVRGGWDLFYFYSRPCGRGDVKPVVGIAGIARDFYSRPCGRGDALLSTPKPAHTPFLLTPLREGRLNAHGSGAAELLFLLTPLREGRQSWRQSPSRQAPYFYSRPCGRGDKSGDVQNFLSCRPFLLTPLREGRPTQACDTRNTVQKFLLTPLREGRRQFSTSPS